MLEIIYKHDRRLLDPHLKRGIIGIYYNISRKHLQCYVNEFIFRYNTKDHTEYDRFNLLLCNTKDRRLIYKDLIN